MKLVGILNVTPDSFSDGGENFHAKDALRSAEKLFGDGADIVDVGAESTNPKSTILTVEQERERLKNIVPQVLATYPGRISLDTYHPETLKWALNFGKPILNDVSGLYRSEMREVAAEYDLTVIIGHLPKASKGIPTAAHTVDPIDDIEEVRDDLLNRVFELEKFGIKKERIILDPNIGFGKTMKLNWQLLKFADLVPDYPVMLGHSKKRFLSTDPKSGEPLKNGQLRFTDEENIEAAKIAAQSGTAYLRVHTPAIYKSI